MRKIVDPHDPYRVRRRPTRPGAAMAFIEGALATETYNCIPFPFGLNADGYARLKHDGRDAYGHVIVCERAHGPRPSPESVAAHSCGKPACVNKRHLRWATHAENSADRVEHGTANGRKLDRAATDFIGNHLARAMRYRDIARMYGVSGSTVSEIVRKRAGGKGR